MTRHSCPSPEGVHLWECETGPDCGYDPELLCRIHRGGSPDEMQASADAMAILNMMGA